MTSPDLNLLLTLNALLDEGSVAGAARRLRLSPSAMSRALARLRATTGDPLLVRAGRGLVPTPRAQALREQVGRLVEEAGEALRPALPPDLTRLDRTFTVRATDGFVENFGAALLLRVRRDAPNARLRFLSRTDPDNAALRDAKVDVEVGVVGEASGLELRTQTLYRDRFVGAVRNGHPLSRGEVTVRRYAEGTHVGRSRLGAERGRLDAALEPSGHQRHIVALVGSFGAALALARTTDLIASVPAQHTLGLRSGLHCFELPFPAPEVTVSMLWHPRLHADPAHEWFRSCLRDACQAGDRAD